jgi:hypothetical protein
MTDGVWWKSTGVYIATYETDRGVCFEFIPIVNQEYEIVLHAASVTGRDIGVLGKPSSPLTIAAGDIDRDGSDEMVAAIDGAGLYYYEPNAGIHRVRLPGSRFSSPVLADIDGDGTLETALRDESRLYLFSGFGVPVSGWPRAIDEAVVGHEDLVSVPSPVVDDIDGNGTQDIMFLVAGDIHAFDFHGRGLEEWPLAGEGSRGGALALLAGESDALYLLDCAAIVPRAVGEGAGAISAAVSSIRRYDLGVENADSTQEWRMHRHDACGYARQVNTGSIENPRSGHVDPSTFIVYPNPAAGAAFTARVMISAPGRVTVTIIDIEGEKVAERTRNHTFPAGSAVPYEETFSTRDLAAGIYICRIEAAGDGWGWNGSKRFAVVR